MLVTKIQAVYLFLMGLWPLLHLSSFEAVTGKKQDKWLVKTIAWLFIVIGLQLWIADPDQVILLGIGAALVIGIADIYYGLVKESISWVYVLDAIPQLIFVAMWLLLGFAI